MTVAFTIQKEVVVVVEWKRGKRGDSNAESRSDIECSTGKSGNHMTNNGETFEFKDMT